jgi:hypothetical protein
MLRKLRRSNVRHTRFMLGAGIAAALAVHASGCASSGQPAPAEEHGGNPSEQTGTVSAKLTLPGGSPIASIAWIITGPNGASSVVQQGTVNVQNSTIVAFVQGGIPAGSNYTIALTGTSTDGTVACAGSASFSVTAGLTSNVSVLLRCQPSGPDSGSASVVGTTFSCATADAISASPAETTIGHSVALVGVVDGPDPANLTFAWSASSGTFSAPSSASTNFTCTAPGAVTVTLTSSDGPVPAGGSCDPTLSTTTVQIQCDGGDAGPSGTADAGAPSQDAAVPAQDAGEAVDASTADASADATVDATTPDAGAAADAGSAIDAAVAEDAGSAIDAGAAVNLDIFRVGDGVGALSNTGNPIFVDEYTTDGVLVGSVPMPTTTNGANRPLVSSGTATSEGFITRSTNGKYVLVTGYGSAIPAASSLPASAAATTPRVIGRIDALGNVDTTTALIDAADGSNPRSVASPDGVNLWFAGAAGGLRFTTLGATTTTQLSTTVTNLRQVEIFGSQLYVSDSSGSAVRLGAVGSGMPTTAGQTIVNLPGFPLAGSPYGFFFADLDLSTPGLDVLYVADDSSGITKYSLAAGVWTSNGTVGSATDAYRGLTGVVNGTSVALYATRTASQLVALADTSGHGGAFAATPNILATVVANAAFRGVTLAPQP